MSYIQQHIQDHCKTAQDVQQAAIKVAKFRAKLAPPRTKIFKLVQKSKPLVRDWLEVASLNSSVDIIPPNTIKNIKRLVAIFYNCTQADLIGQRRVREYIIPRHVAMYFCRHYTDRSYPEIGRAFGGRDHTTVIHGVNSITIKMQTDRVLLAAIIEIKSFLEDEIRKWNQKRTEKAIVYW